MKIKLLPVQVILNNQTASGDARSNICLIGFECIKIKRQPRYLLFEKRI